MDRYFHDAPNRTVHLAYEAQWSPREKSVPSSFSRELVGWNVCTPVVSMSAAGGPGDRYLDDVYPSPPYSQEMAADLWEHLVPTKVPGKEIDQSEYETLHALYSEEYARKGRGE